MRVFSQHLITVRPERRRAAPKSKDGRPHALTARSSFDFVPAALRSGRTDMDVTWFGGYA